jgi:endothelin-converting enzyme/putative endopeptidase
MPPIRAVVCALFLAPLAAADSYPPPPELNRFDPSWVDRALDPCDDFYRYTCSRWLKEHPIPADQAAWGTGSNLRIWNETVLRDTMVQAADASAQRTPGQQRIGDYWAACMNESAIEKAGLSPLAPALAVAASFKDKRGLARALARMHELSVDSWTGTNDDNATPAPAFGFGPVQDYKDSSTVVAQLDQGGMGLPSRDYYLSDNPKLKEARGKYREHLRKMFALAGDEPDTAARNAAAVLRIETALARAATDNVRRRDPKKVYNPLTLAQVKKLAPAFDWSAYFSQRGAALTPQINVTAPAFFKGLNGVVAKESVAGWQAYLRWWALHGAARYLPSAFTEENFDFYSRTLAGTKEQRPRWRRCVQYADRDLGEALGEAYVQRAFPPEAKARIDALVIDVERALAVEFDELDWMSAQTRAAAKAKLLAMENKIGYPKMWRDYSRLAIGQESLLANVEAATAFEARRQLDKIGKPVDRSEWQMTPPTINAYNDPQLNTINFPAGILQPPFFDAKGDDPANYGAIGMIIGHEITHGFDDQGRKFDEKGNLKDWWTPEDGKHYDERASCIAEEYSGEVPGLGVKQDGRLTLGEDSSDNGGLRIAYKALAEALKGQGKSLDDKDASGFTARQRFFLSHAYSWCAALRPEVARTAVVTNPHSLPERRVNNVESNMPEFQEAFGCKQGTSMVRAKACRVW